MKVLVAVKRVIDFSTRIQIKKDNSGIETVNVKMAINPFDEIALEEAIRLKEKGIAKEIIAVSIGSSVNQDILRTAFAMGADRALLVETEDKMQPLGVAKILQAIALKESPELILLGKQAIDSDNNQTGQMLAGLLNWPQGTFASKITIEDNHTLTVVREIDGGLETLSLQLPAVVTSDLRLNEPRYLSLPNIMQAKRKTIEVMKLADFNLSINSHLQTLNIAAPAKREGGIKVATVKELLNKLKEAQVIQ